MNADRYFDGDAFPEDFFPGTGEEHGGFGEEDEIERNFEIRERDLTQKILFRTVRTLERSVANWRHLSSRAQRKMIKDQFNFFLGLIDDEGLADDLDSEEKD